ncbi:unnamed protein product [Absidia cylindrospora]
MATLRQDKNIQHFPDSFERYIQQSTTLDKLLSIPTWELKKIPHPHSWNLPLIRNSICAILPESLSFEQQCILFCPISSRTCYSNDSFELSLEVIDKAMRMEHQAQIRRDLQQHTTPPTQAYDPNAMDIDHVRQQQIHGRLRQRRKPHLRPSYSSSKKILRWGTKTKKKTNVFTFDI